MQIQKLEQYCKVMLLDYEIEDSIISIDNKVYKIIEDGNRDLFNKDMEFIVGEDLTDDIDGYIYEFGGRWYLQEVSEKNIQLIELKYIGKASQKVPTKSFLGIRSSYELLNGMGLYKDWIKKAKFLGIESLAICERSTLAGALTFQNECNDAGLKSIIGMTIPVMGASGYDLKLYAKGFQGWLNLLKFNEKLNVGNEHNISEQFLLRNSNDLFIVADPKYMGFETVSKGMAEVIDFYQLETVKFINEEKDDEFIDNLEKWIKSDFKPISITDAFYLEKADWRTREVVWATAKSFDDKTNNQYFKSKYDYVSELATMFEKGNKSWVKLFKEAVASEQELVDGCSFVYDTKTRHLPKYIMTEEESLKYNNKEELFLDLIKNGFKERNITDAPKYIERLKKEVGILKKGDVIDYFLDLYTIVTYAKENDLLTGVGRGSAGGSLVAYLLGIIQIDPIEFDLLFERFLNEGRMGSWEDKPYFIFEDDNGNEIGLAEGDIARVIRDGKELILFCHEIIEGDEIIKY